MLRRLEKDDAEKFLKLLKNLDNESSFMMYEADERKITVAELEKAIETAKDLGIIYGIEVENEIVAYISAERLPFNRAKHCAYIVVGVLKEHSGKGYASRLLEAVEKWAQKNNVCRLELTVMIHNERAYKLYKKMGYEKEGTKRKSLLVDGKFVDEYYMSKLV